MYTCMLVHVYLGGLSNNDHHSEPRQNFNFFQEEGGSLGHSICICHNQAVQDNVYLMSSKCKEVNPSSQNSSTLFPYKVITVQIFIQNKTGLLGYVNNNHNNSITLHVT